MLFSKAPSSYVSGSGNTLVTVKKKKLAASLNLAFHTVAESLLTPCSTFHSRQLKTTPVIILPTVAEEAHGLVLPLVVVFGTLFLTARGP